MPNVSNNNPAPIPPMLVSIYDVIWQETIFCQLSIENMDDMDDIFISRADIDYLNLVDFVCNNNNNNLFIL